MPVAQAHPRGWSPLRRWLGIASLVPLLVGVVSGCATTQAYEREVLAKPVMAPDGATRRLALKEHYLGTREGAVGGFGGGGGGCGCN